MDGQNERAFPVVTQYARGQTRIVWPLRLRTAAPVLPLPPSSPYAAR
jgi:branched-chain amino acid transport system substrate-binding protein